MQQPPLLPGNVVDRVQSLARRNGWSIVLVAGASALVSGAEHDAVNALLGLFAAGCGAMEVHGAGLLRGRDDRGTQWMIRGEILLLFVILIYCALRLSHPNLRELHAAFQASLEIPGMKEHWAEMESAGLTEEAYVSLLNRLVAIVFALVSVLYQSGMALYYSRRRELVTQALADE